MNYDLNWIKVEILLKKNQSLGNTFLKTCPYITQIMIFFTHSLPKNQIT